MDRLDEEKGEVEKRNGEIGREVVQAYIVSLKKFIFVNILLHILDKNIALFFCVYDREYFIY